VLTVNTFDPVSTGVNRFPSVPVRFETNGVKWGIWPKIKWLLRFCGEKEWCAL